MPVTSCYISIFNIKITQMWTSEPPKLIIFISCISSLCTVLFNRQIVLGSNEELIGSAHFIKQTFVLQLTDHSLIWYYALFFLHGWSQKMCNDT